MSSDSGAESSNSANEAEKAQIEKFHLPTPEEIRGQDIWNNCAVRSVVSGVMGGGLGVMMGIFFAALDNPIMQDTMTTRQQLAYTARQMGQRSWGNCKTFAVMGFIFSAAECVVEKYRAKHDTTNTVVAGCVTGGAISAKGSIVKEDDELDGDVAPWLKWKKVSGFLCNEGGPQAACVGCAGFAAFSVAIEKLLERYE